MKRIISLMLVCASILCTLFLSGCFGMGKAEKTDGVRKFGFAIESRYGTPTDADGEDAGDGTAVLTAAAVLIGADGKIKKCVLDCAENKLSYTADGKYVRTSEFKTKREAGKNYGMSAAGAQREWYEQADVFESLVKEKTVSEVKKLVSTGGKGNDEVIKAGCTISVEDFVLAIEKAAENAEKTDASEEDDIRLGVATTQTGCEDASDEADGVAAAESTFFAALVNSDGTLTDCRCDCVHAEIPFDENGEEELEDNAKLKSKRELGKNYGMSAGGAKKEWYEQADAFEKQCIGKNYDEIAHLEKDDGYGTDELQRAGCTIMVSEFVRAASRALKQDEK